MKPRNSSDWHTEKHKRAFTRWLRNNGIRFALTGGNRELRAAPSHLILDRPPRKPYRIGTAVLFKHPECLPSDTQSDWLSALDEWGWETVIAFAMDEAATAVEQLGYTPKDEGNG